MSKFIKLLAISLPILLSACASTERLHLMADQRASLLKSKLPLQYGPLNVTTARADEHVVEITMIYNQGGAVSAEQVINGGIANVCKFDESRSVINQGVVYRILMRSERGSLIADTYITEEVCDSLEN